MIDPTALAAALKACAAVCALQLAPGAWPAIHVTPWSMPTGWAGTLSLDATGVTSPGFRCDGLSGVSLTGGTWGPAPYADVLFVRCDNASVDHATATGGLTAGFAAFNLDGFTADSLTIFGSGSDGLDLYGVSNADAGHVVCYAYSPPVNGNHPDCVQLASEPGFPATSVKVHDSYAFGMMQGFSLFDHAPGASNIVFDRNVAAISYSQCSAIYFAKGGAITNTTCFTLPGAQWAAKVHVDATASGIVTSGNQDGAAP